MSTPAIIVASRYITAQKANKLKQSYEKFVDYVDREDAKTSNVKKNVSNMNEEELFRLYLDYMRDERKQGELFTKDKDTLDNAELVKMREAFNLSQRNGSPLWQDVISFDNKWLEEQGMYDPQSHTLDEGRMRLVIREAVGEMLKLEKMEHSAAWTGAIHYNTQNIHVHVAIVEPIPTREKKWFHDKDTNEWRHEYRGNRKQSSIETMKSRVANRVLDRKEQYQRIDELVRETRKTAIEEKLKLLSNKKMSRLFLKALSRMPDDLKQWRYGYESINEARPYIDEIVDLYLETYHKDELKELDELLNEQVQIDKRLYGDNSNHEQTKINKLYEGSDSLKYKMGNVVLTEMRNYVKEERKQSFLNKNKQVHQHRDRQQYNNVHFSLLRLNAGMRKRFHEYQKDRNLAEFDRMMDGYER